MVNNDDLICRNLESEKTESARSVCSASHQRKRLIVYVNVQRNPKPRVNKVRLFESALKFQLLVFLDYTIRCSMKLVWVGVDMDQNWQSYGNPKRFQHFENSSPPPKMCVVLYYGWFWVVILWRFFLAQEKFQKVVFPTKKVFFSKFQNSDFRILKSN